VIREDIFIVSKLFDTKDGREGAVSVIEDSLKLIGFQYIDLYLLHSPQGGKVLE
jgi:diketogulonate reductase-like aldo/keto reductase